MILELLIASKLATPQAEVYFIQNTSTKAVKIGKTYYGGSSKRMKAFQTANSEKLVLVKTIPQATHLKAFKEEAELHRLLRKHKIRGEWYTKSSNN